MNAPYAGGSEISAELFMVDGDFTQCDPCGLPVFSYPLKGDSIFSNRNVLYLSDIDKNYYLAPFGVFPNLQPWSPNQTAMILEQEFMVAQSSYEPMRLNTPYNPDWATGWRAQFPNDQGTVQLDNFYLVSEGELQDMGAGISKIKRTWASIPQTRNEIEQFSANFPGYSDQMSGASRAPFVKVVQSRLQYDYYIFDDYDILDIPLFPAGIRMNATTGMSPPNFILTAQQYFSNTAGVEINEFVDSVDDGDGSVPPTFTVPDYAQYVGLVNGSITSNGQPAEIIAESSTLTRYMGNIWERRTRFVIAQ